MKNLAKCGIWSLNLDEQGGYSIGTPDDYKSPFGLPVYQYGSKDEILQTLRDWLEIDIKAVPRGFTDTASTEMEKSFITVLEALPATGNHTKHKKQNGGNVK